MDFKSFSVFQFHTRNRPIGLLFAALVRRVGNSEPAKSFKSHFISQLFELFNSF
jgi:hypothetical protein